MSREFDVIVIGGGHAGVEAAAAVSRMGGHAGIITMDPAKLALMSCNPAIGGIGKSQLVKEIDALGGLMGLATDATGIQFRRLNLSRGPAVWSTRVQSDRDGYNMWIVDAITADSSIDVIAGLAGEITVEGSRVVGVRLEDGEAIGCGAVVVATGTFLGGLIHIGDKKIQAGRIGENAAYRLSDSFAQLGFELGRLKTGTPPRLDGRTIDWSQCTEQPGEAPIPWVSRRSQRQLFEQTPCWLTATTEATREIVLANVDKSPMFNGQIDSDGPRYCPSIEDKFYRFADKPRHQIFLEPEGTGTDEVYPNGFSTSLPEAIQLSAMRTITGLEEVKFTRPGYAVEYDYCPTHQITPSLETRRVTGLFFAGQINGTSGYEEAAAQGLIAGANALLGIRGEPSIVLDRSTAYIGVMIDDLVTRSTTEPYRMFTSRAEYRLALREDNAYERLAEIGHAHHLLSDHDYQDWRTVRQLTNSLVARMEQTRVSAETVHDDASLRDGVVGSAPSYTLADLARQPKIAAEALLNSDLWAAVQPPDVSRETALKAVIEVRYAGYIAKQEREIARFQRNEREQIPESFSYESINGLKAEAREKFVRYRPASLGQAGRIEGVTPGDVAVLSVHVKRFKAARP